MLRNFKAYDGVPPRSSRSFRYKRYCVRLNSSHLLLSGEYCFTSRTVYDTVLRPYRGFGAAHTHDASSGKLRGGISDNLTTKQRRDRFRVSTYTQADTLETPCFVRPAAPSHGQTLGKVRSSCSLHDQGALAYFIGVSDSAVCAWKKNWLGTKNGLFFSCGLVCTCLMFTCLMFGCSVSFFWFGTN